MITPEEFQARGIDRFGALERWDDCRIRDELNRINAGRALVKAAIRNCTVATWEAWDEVDSACLYRQFDLRARLAAACEPWFQVPQFFWVTGK